MKPICVHLSVVLSCYRPTDMLDGAPPYETRPEALWPHVFASIERNHVALSPSYWARFRKSVMNRQRTPIKVADVNGALCVVNGHHRVWALVKGGAESVRVEFVK